MGNIPTSDAVLSMANDIRTWREQRGWSTAVLAQKAIALALRAGEPSGPSQQTISNFEQGNAKRMPGWIKYVVDAFIQDDMMKPDNLLDNDAVSIEILPTYAGAGGGGTGEGDIEKQAFSRYLVERELRAEPEDLVCILVEGNSMDPDFQSGDQLLVDKRKTSLAQPGAFCLWDGDGYVIKYVEKISGSDPLKIRVISRNTIYSTVERLGEEVSILGRVVWFARRV